MTGLGSSLQSLQELFDSNATLSYEFRRQQLENLKKAIEKYEDEINTALKKDLGKSKEESWATEIGLLMAEIKLILKNLRKWMRPEKVSAGLITFPSTGKIYHDPLGVVLIISPWNYPLQLLLTPLVGAIAGGNCIVLKPSELAPATEKVIQKIIEETFPGNYIRVVTGEGADVVPRMIHDFRFAHIFYTGSTGVGKEVYKMAAKDLVPVTLELGGKSPCIVYEDADLEVAAKRIVLGKFLNAGQTCIAPDYILIQEPVRERLLAELKNAIQKFYSEDAMKSSDYGKIINQSRFKKLKSYLSEAYIFYGGKTNDENLYIEPTILVDNSMDDPVMNEEIFGPILPVLSFAKTEDAMQMVKQNENPLALYLFTKNKTIEEEWVKKVPFGGGCINNAVWQFAVEAFPFGGIGNSGIGAYHGKNSFNLFTHAKPVLKTGTWLDPSLKYPPFKGKLRWFKKLLG
ncbi:MAG: aldehyde dehydrogenase [Ginsengibacter sp.]